MANNVRIRVGVDDQATRPIRNLHDAFKRLQVDGAKGVALGLGAGAGLAAWGAANRAIMGVTDALGDSVRAAIEEEAGIKRLGQSLKANVAGYDGNTEAIEKTIAARERLGFADDEQRDALARAVAATHDVAAAQDILSTAMDLARFKGISLGEATDALVRVESGQFRMLKSLGIELAANATQQEALAAVQKVAAGQADEFSKTTAGAMDRAGVAVDNLKEAIGERLLPVVGDLANALTGVLAPATVDVMDEWSVAGAILNKLVTDPAGLPGYAKELAIAAKATDEAQSATDRYNHYLDSNAGALKIAADAAKAASGAIDLVGDSASDIIGPMSGAELAIRGVGAALSEVRAEAAVALGDLGHLTPDARSPGKATPRNVLPDQGARRAAQAAADAAARTREAATNEAERKAAERRREAERKAAEAARDGFDVAKRAAHDYFDDLHDRNLKAIDDARDLANAVIDEQQRSIRGALTAEQERVQGMRDAEREMELRADVANAAPEDLAGAQKALNRFLEDQRLEFLGDRANEQIAGLEGQKDANNLAAGTATDKENARNEAQVAKFDRLIDALEKKSQPIQLLVDGRLIAEIVADYLAGRSSVTSPVTVSTGSVR